MPAFFLIICASVAAAFDDPKVISDDDVARFPSKAKVRNILNTEKN